MGNYKIKVNDEAESKEAQELFFELGYYWNSGFGVRHLDVNFLYAKNKQITIGYCSEHFSSNPCCELTLPQLRDLVAKSKNEQGLISGADALRALADGKEVEYLGETKTWFSLNKETSAWSLTEVLNATDLKEGTSFKFRLKPRTIKLEIEIPAPFKPKDGDMVWFISDYHTNGYSSVVFENLAGFQFGAWRTEEEIKQVVAALRGGIKA